MFSVEASDAAFRRASRVFCPLAAVDIVWGVRTHHKHAILLRRLQRACHALPHLASTSPLDTEACWMRLRPAQTRHKGCLGCLSFRASEAFPRRQVKLLHMRGKRVVAKAVKHS